MTDREHKELGNIVEQKILEFFGDPDHKLGLKKSFVQEIRKRLKKKQVLVAHSDVMKRYGFR